MYPKQYCWNTISVHPWNSCSLRNSVCTTVRNTVFCKLRVKYRYWLMMTFFSLKTDWVMAECLLLDSPPLCISISYLHACTWKQELCTKLKQLKHCFERGTQTRWIWWFLDQQWRWSWCRQQRLGWHSIQEHITNTMLYPVNNCSQCTCTNLYPVHWVYKNNVSSMSFWNPLLGCDLLQLYFAVLTSEINLYMTNKRHNQNNQHWSESPHRLRIKSQPATNFSKTVMIH